MEMRLREKQLDYLEIFYCTCDDSPAVGYFVLLCGWWCCSTSSGTWQWSTSAPSWRAVKGAASVADDRRQGNGANDIFTNVISFTRSADANLSLNSVLRGAFFISCFVVDSSASSASRPRLGGCGWTRRERERGTCCSSSSWRIAMNIFERIDFLVRAAARYSLERERERSILLVHS